MEFMMNRKFMQFHFFRNTYRVLSGTVLLFLVISLALGCSSTKRKGEKTLEMKDLTLSYRNKVDGGPDVASLKMAHPLKISERMVVQHLSRLHYENFALLGEAGPVFTRADIKRLKRLLTKALNNAKPQNIIIFEIESEEGTTVGQVFASKGNLHWRFEEIRGVKHSLTRNQLARYGTAWRLIPKKGQRYQVASQLLGSRPKTNWIIAKLNIAMATQSREKASVPQNAPQPPPDPPVDPAPASTPSATPKVDPDLEEKLKFLKRLYENELIDQREYQKKRQDLLDQYL
jgi:hypothetical protein